MQAPPLPDSDWPYVTRNHYGEIVSGALFSQSNEHRYALWRVWDDGPLAMFNGLNPSTADDLKNDPTCSREINFCRRWGFAGYIKCNIHAVRSTDPKPLKTMSVEHATGGLGNDIALAHYAQLAALVVVCWGVHGELFTRGQQVARLLRSRAALFAFHFWRDGKYLAEVAGGHPRHTLYLPATARLHEFRHTVS